MPRIRTAPGRCRSIAIGVAIGLVLAAAPAAAEGPVLDIEGMRFTTSDGGVTELLLESDSARFDTVRQVAFLQDVSARVAPGEEHEGFAMTCDRGVLDLATNDFRFRGHVLGRTDDGRRFAARWVRYKHDEALLYTDESVLITEASGTSYRGGGFRYYVKERRFRLLGGATLVQEEQ